ncbi:hypothetical protein [Mesorhizobium sp. BE184]|uniref:hypothetical protein n=1 Tax=Mesorhizobium sp. BE184 TaxID=2817714 RepID=UPI00285DF0D9|nr:hypothetical protein [Mesorhizobium sp. BE184]MDR7035236.1 hypothetical protein [Mesorhizobium sp. BE184]
MDTFLIFDVEDRLNASVCIGEAQAREIVGNFGSGASIRVHRVTMDEMVRDVTEDFVSVEADKLAGTAWDRACAAGDRAYQIGREVA